MKEKRKLYNILFKIIPYWLVLLMAGLIYLGLSGVREGIIYDIVGYLFYFGHIMLICALILLVGVWSKG